MLAQGLGRGGGGGGSLILPWAPPWAKRGAELQPFGRAARRQALGLSGGAHIGGLGGPLAVVFGPFKVPMAVRPSESSLQLLC